MMAGPIISFVVAMDRNRLIGADGELPWRLPDDMKHFREITMGKMVLMGRITYESIPERFRPLSGRTNVILTKKKDYIAPGCLIVHTLDEALTAAADEPELVVIGGAQLYEQLLSRADRIYLTLVEGEFKGDAYFPELDMSQWQERASLAHDQDERHAVPFTILLLERVLR